MKTKKKPQEYVVISYLVLSVCMTIISLIYLVLTTAKVNNLQVEPQAGQLLNQTSIQKAAQMLNDNTVDFSQEEL